MQCVSDSDGELFASESMRSQSGTSGSTPTCTNPPVSAGFVAMREIMFVQLYAILHDNFTHGYMYSCIIFLRQ